MMEKTYAEMLKIYKDPAELRAEMVKRALEIGIKPAAREFKTTPATVRKWLKRYKEGKRPALADRSRRPKTSPRAMKKCWQFKIEDVVKRAERDNKRLNSGLVKRKNAIPYSQKTVLKHMKKDGYSTKSGTRAKKKRDLRDVKAKLRPFETLQVDIKYLDDIPEFYADFKRYNLPKYQITARDVRTGALFFAYAREKTSTNTTMFLLRLGEHLHKFGVDLSKVKVQTDNGTEFASVWNSLKDCVFTKAIKKAWGSTHLRIPPRAPTYQSDVETSHNLIENEFYAYEYFDGELDFYKKAAKYQREFNLERFNGYKKGTPRQIFSSCGTQISEAALEFKPVCIDNFWQKYKNEFVKFSFDPDDRQGCTMSG